MTLRHARIARLRVTLAAIAIVLAACNPQPKNRPVQATAAPSAAPTSSGAPAVSIVGRGTAKQPVRIVGQTGNRKQYELTARSEESHSTQTIAQASFQQTTVVFYDKSGTTLRAQAPRASIDERSQKVRLSGGVHATTSSGVTLVCDTLVYDRRNSRIHGEGNVRITGSQGGSRTVLTGNAFDSDVTLTQMLMK
jgi:LPS export ABC transporter protein LptC